MPAAKGDSDDLLVKIPAGQEPESFQDLLTRATLYSAIRDRALCKQGIRAEDREHFGDGGNLTVEGLQVATYLSEKFASMHDVTPKMWQQRVRMFESYTPVQLKQKVLELSETVQTLTHVEARQEVYRALAHLQRFYPAPDKRMREGTGYEMGSVKTEGELSGLANPDQTVRVVQPDDNGQCPRGTLWSARVGGCVAIDDGKASTGFDTSAGGNRADSDLRKARGGTDRRQFTPEGTDVMFDPSGADRKHPDNYGTPNRAMGNAGAIEVSDRNIDTQQMPGGSRVSDVTVQARSRPRESLREGELSGMSNPDNEVEVVPADANGQCRPGWIYSARLGGCVRIADGTAQTGHNTAAGGNLASSDLRKARSLTGRQQFTPEGTDVLTDAGNSNQRHPDNYGRPNRAMGNAGIETSDVGIRTQEMPGGQRVNDVSVQTRVRTREGFSEGRIDRVCEGELSGMPNPDQVLNGTVPDAHGQCPRGHMFSAMVGRCIPLTVDQQVAVLKGNRTRHTPEGTVTRMGRTYGVDNSDQPNPAMGFYGPLAALEDEGPTLLSKQYGECMIMLRDASYSYYASKHASEQYCFYQFEGRYDGYSNSYGNMTHLSDPTLMLAEDAEKELDTWLKCQESDYLRKTSMDDAYQRDLQERLRYRHALEVFVRRDKTNPEIKQILEANNLPAKTIRSLMQDLPAIRHATKQTRTPRIIIKTGNNSFTAAPPMTKQQQIEQLQAEAKRRTQRTFHTADTVRNDDGE